MRGAVNGIRERWIWIRQHWILITFLSVALYILPFIQTQWAVHGYPGFLGFLNPAVEEKYCVPGIVHRLIVSDAVVYSDWTQSSHQDGLEHYYLVILHDDGSQSIREVTYTIARHIRSWTRWSCETTTWSNRLPTL